MVASLLPFTQSNALRLNEPPGIFEGKERPPKIAAAALIALGKYI
jgi:hypothetical protein